VLPFPQNILALLASEYDPRSENERNTMSENLTMRTDNKGLTVKINFWSLEKVVEQFDSEMARLWIKGQVTHAGTKDVVKFNDAGELLSILGKWNKEKFQELKTKKQA